MKAFVIKSKEGYYKRNKIDYVDVLDFAAFYMFKEDAESNILDDDDEVVEITIAETKYLEQDINESLKQQLAEKEKEINKLQQMAIIDMQAKEILELQVATIRKQVCDEIRKGISDLLETDFNLKENELQVITFYGIKQVLDEIEKKVGK